MQKQQVQAEALSRARTGRSWANYPTIFQGFAEKGIPEHEILPRENVFTYQAWKALGRYVRKGEKGVKVLTWVPMTKKRINKDTGEEETVTGRRPKTATVFHVSQTEPANGS